MTKKNIENKKFSKISIFVSVQVTLLLSSLFIYILSNDSFVCFFSLFVLYTVLSVMMIEMILFFIYNLNKSSRLKEKLFALFMILIFLVGSIGIVYWTSRYYKDIPFVIRREYKIEIGKCTYAYANYGKVAHLDVKIGEIDFDISLEYKDFIKKGNYYKVEYLPNTKEVIAIYGR